MMIPWKKNKTGELVFEHTNLRFVIRDFLGHPSLFIREEAEVGSAWQSYEVLHAATVDACKKLAYTYLSEYIEDFDKLSKKKKHLERIVN